MPCRAASSYRRPWEGSEFGERAAACETRLDGVPIPDRILVVTIAQQGQGTVATAVVEVNEAKERVLHVRAKRDDLIDIRLDALALDFGDLLPAERFRRIPLPEGDELLPLVARELVLVERVPQVRKKRAKLWHGVDGLRDREEPHAGQRRGEATR